MIRTKSVTPARTNNPDFDDWHSRIKHGAKNFRESQWEFIDLLVEGSDRFEGFSQVIDDLGFSEQTIANYLSIGRKWPAEIRRVHIAPSSHAVFSFLEEREQRVTAISAADMFGWKREECRLRADAWRDGQKRAFDPKYKPEPRVKAGKAARERADDVTAGVNDDDTAIMDKGAVGQALKAEDRREVLTALAEQKLSTANQRLFDVLGAIKGMRNDPAFLAALEPAGLNAQAIQIEGQWLVNVAAETRHRQNVEFDRRPRPSAPEAAHAESGASRGGEGAAQPSPITAENSATNRANTLARSDEDHLGPIPSHLRRQ